MVRREIRGLGRLEEGKNGALGIGHKLLGVEHGNVTLDVAGKALSQVGKV